MGILRTDKISGLETSSSNNFGPNLLYNGDFSKGTDGWSATNSNHTVSSGQLTVTNTGTNGRATSTAFDTVIGEVYEISIHNVSTTGQFRLEIREGNGSGSENPFDSNNSVAGVRTLRFVATETAHSLVVYAIGGSGTTSVYSDITVRKINNIVTGSVYFDGTGDYLSVTPVTYSLVNWWESDFTIEAWIYADSFSGWYADGNPGYKIPAMFGHMNPSDGTNYWSFGPVENGKLEFYYWKGSQDHRFITSSSISTGRWSHIAMSYSVTNGAKVFIDGKGTDYISLDGTPQANASTAVTIGQYTGIDIEGYISNLRVLAGTALYTEDFTPPVHALEVIGDTVLLCCNNPDSVTAEGTGKTLSSAGNPNFVTKNPGLTRDFTSGTEFRGVTTFDTQGYFVPPSGTTEQRGRGRGLIAGGYSGSSEVNNIEYVTIASSGNAQDFGDLTVARRDGAGCASATRGLVFAGGFPTNTNIIDYVEISSTSNAIDFGDTTENSAFLGAAVSNSTRGVFAGGIKTASPIRVNPEMQYVTIASRGDTLEFGELSVTRYAMQGAGSPTRGMFFGGAPAPAPAALTNTIDYITIAATGNAVDFGDISVADRNTMACSNSIRSVIAGGQNPSQHQYRIEYVTNASTGNSVDFGSLIISRSRGAAASSQTRGVIFAGYGPDQVNTIEYITFATTGNASDFGDTIQVIRDQAGFSDSHGGIS